jgi:hypothetical protein
VFIATVISKWPEADFARGNCFPAGTPVATERGTVPIEAVESGERVWSFDFRAGQWVLCRVALVHSAAYEGEVLTLLFEDGTSLQVTADHPVWVIEGEGLATRPQLHYRDANEDSGFSLPGRWVHSQALRVGDQLCGRDGGRVRVQAILSRQALLPVYNLSVLGLPYYAVGLSGILVHNTESNIPSGKPVQRVASRRPTQLAPPDALPTRVGYRVVEDAELQDLIARGRWHFPDVGDTPTGQPGKWFYPTRAEALDTAADWSAQGGGPFTLVRSDIPVASITYRQSGIDATATMPQGKTGLFSEFAKGLAQALIEIISEL